MLLQGLCDLSMVTLFYTKDMAEHSLIFDNNRQVKSQLVPRWLNALKIVTFLLDFDIIDSKTLPFQNLALGSCYYKYLTN